MLIKCNLICTIKIKVVILHPKFLITMYRTPEAYIADVELLTGKSYRTAQRIMVKIKKALGITGRKRPTIEQVKTYLMDKNIEN